MAGFSPQSGLQYLGVRPPTPPNMIVPGTPLAQPRNPTPNDVDYQLGDFWLNKTTKQLWTLVFLGSHNVSGYPARFATWVEITGGGLGTVITLTGNSGGPVPADGAGNINVIGDGVTVNVVGTPGTNTLTISAVGTGTVETLTGDDGIPVTPLAGNINVLGQVFSGSTVEFEGSTPHALNLQVTDANNNVLMGFSAGNAGIVAAGGSNNTGLGLLVGHALTSGTNNTMLGYESGTHIAGGIGNTGVGSLSLTSVSSGGSNTAVGYTALQSITTASNSTAVGDATLLACTGGNNTAVGQGAGTAVTTGTGSTIIGYNCGNAFTTGSNNIILGTSAGNTLATGDSNNILLGAAPGVAGTSNLIQMTIPGGNNYLLNYGTNNTFLGNNAGNTATLVVGNATNEVGIGRLSLNALTTGASNASVGSLSGQSINTGSNNAILGQGSLTTATSSSGNCVLGQGSLVNLGTGSNNIVIGQGAGNGYTSNETQAILIGQGQAGSATEVASIRIGQPASLAGTSNGNIFIGVGAGNTGTLVVGTALNNCCIGTSSGFALTTGQANTFMGAQSGAACTTGSNNDAVGVNSLAACTTGGSNSALGNATLAELISGNSNSAVGRFALGSLTTGSGNCAYGSTAGEALLTGSHNCFLGNAAGGVYTGAESSNICIINGGVIGESNTIRIGTDGAGDSQQNRCFIAGIRGITTGNNDAVAVLIDSASQLGTVSSSARFKENIQDLGSQSDILYKLRPVAFNYKSDLTKSPAWGLIAEEVAEVFPQLVVYDKEGKCETVKYHDLPALLLNEIQRLNARIEELEKKLN